MICIIKKDIILKEANYSLASNQKFYLQKTMANITISDLRPAGFDLFSSSESFMTELNEEEINIKGGITPGLAAGVVIGWVAHEVYDYLTEE